MADSSVGDNSGRENSARLSPHLVDVLIRDLIDARRFATDEEIIRIVDRIATVPFDQALMTVRQKDRGMQYQGRTLSNREDSWFVHLV